MKRIEKKLRKKNTLTHKYLFDKHSEVLIIIE